MATTEQLGKMVSYVNSLTGNSQEVYEDGKWNVGSFSLAEGLGGFALERVMNIHGGMKLYLNAYHVPKKEFEARLKSFIQGIEFIQGEGK